MLASSSETHVKAFERLALLSSVVFMHGNLTFFF